MKNLFHLKYCCFRKSLTRDSEDLLSLAGFQRMDQDLSMHLRGSNQSAYLTFYERTDTSKAFPIDHSFYPKIPTRVIVGLHIPNKDPTEENEILIAKKATTSSFSPFGEV
jgi:hypothetical protein